MVTSHIGGSVPIPGEKFFCCTSIIFFQFDCFSCSRGMVQQTNKIVDTPKAEIWNHRIAKKILIIYLCQSFWCQEWNSFRAHSITASSSEMVSTSALQIRYLGQYGNLETILMASFSLPGMLKTNIKFKVHATPLHSITEGREPVNNLLFTT